MGDVGRPGLSPAHTPQQLAAMLYRNIHEKLLTLPDDTEIFPRPWGRIALRASNEFGSSCNIGNERQVEF